MADILFVTWDGGGNVPPAVGIATELVRRGHTVRFAGHATQADRFAAAGLPFAAYPTARPFDSSSPTPTPAMLATFGDRAMGRDVLEELRRRPADLVVVDALLFGVMAALQGAGHGYAVLEHTVDGYLRAAARGPLGLLLRLRGLRPMALVDAGGPTLVASLRELEPGRRGVPAHLVHTGPVVTGVPARPERPTVLLSLSTFAFRALPDTWQRLLDAVEGLPARVVATTGPALDTTALRVPTNVEVHPWLPHEEVLPQVSLVVGHGGHATMTAALAHDVPMLVLPLDDRTDQPVLGRSLETAGAGRTLHRKAPPQRIRAAVEELLAPGPHREAAARLGALIRERPGAATAADLLEARLSAAGAPGPVPPTGRPAA